MTEKNITETRVCQNRQSDTTNSLSMQKSKADIFYLRWGRHVTSKLYLDEAYSTFRRFLRSSIMTNNSDRYSSYFTYPILIYRYSIL